MQALTAQTYAAVPRSHAEPGLDSHDSGEEFSFYHWIEVCRLVDEADVSTINKGLLCSAEFEEALKKTLSEVESATADQNFTGNVV
jgi:hypothetical protein